MIWITLAMLLIFAVLGAGLNIGWTNKGKTAILDSYFRATGTPTNFFVALVTSATTPTADTNTLSDLTEITVGNGYVTGGISLTRDATDFDSLIENDGADRGEIQIKDILWTAAGGPIPASGDDARFAVLTDDNVTIGSREIIGYWDLVADRSVSVGQILTLQDLELRLKES